MRVQAPGSGGDVAPGVALLAAAVTVYADGGGEVPAHTTPVAGFDNVMELFASVFAARSSRLAPFGFINGLPGFVTVERGDILQTTALEIQDGRIVAVYVVRNPDKLRHMADTGHRGGLLATAPALAVAVQWSVLVWAPVCR